MDFSMGSGGSEKQAKALATDTNLRIVEMGIKKSNFQRKVQKGSHAGETVDQYQLYVLFETLAGGTTLAYEKGKAGSRVKVPAEEYAAGDRFAHYYGGVYPKDGGGFNIPSEGLGMATAFLNAMIALGVPPTGKWSAYYGAVVTIENVRGVAPNGVYFTPLPKALVSPPGTPGPATATEAPAAGLPANAYTALSKGDQDAVREAAAMGDLNTDNLVETGLAKTHEAAQEIINGFRAARRASLAG